MATKQSEAEQRDGVFIEIDEDDPFEKVALHVLCEDGSGFIAGTLETEPGRYELKKVSDDD